jgi:hypothetical protein
MSADNMKALAGEIEDLNDVIEAMRGSRDVLRVSGNVGDSQDVGVIGIDRFADLARRISAALRAPEADDAYREAVDTEMMLCHLGVATGDAKKDLHAIINWNVDVALDPRVSERARTLQASAASPPAASAGAVRDDTIKQRASS